MLKTADTLISFLLVAAGFITVLANQDIRWLIRFYFIVGGWQVISMLVHFFTGWFMNKNGSRSIYHWFVTAIFLIAAAGFITPAMWIILYFLLFISPVLAVIYISICLSELKKLKSEKSVRLK